MSGDSQGHSRDSTPSTRSQRAATSANGSATIENSALLFAMDSGKSADHTRASEQTENTAFLSSGVSNQQKPKKSSFQITKVITKNKDDIEPADDLDETNTEDLSSGVLDSSKMTDADQEPSSADTLHSPGGEDQWPSPAGMSKPPAPAAEPKEKVVDTHSRFKIVKIESKDRTKKGRWTCMDFADPEHTEKSDEHGTGNNSAANSIYYIPGTTDDQSKSPFAAAIVYNQGHPVLEPNLLKSPLYMSDSSFQQLPFFSRPYMGTVQPISFSEQEMFSRLREQQLPTSGSLPSNSLPAGTIPAGSLPSGTLPAGSLPSSTKASGTLSAGTLPASTLPASTLTSGSLQSGSLSTGTLPSGSLPPVSFAHGGLLPTSEIMSATQAASSKPFSPLFASDVGANCAAVVDDSNQLADARPPLSDSDQRSIALSGKESEQTTIPSKRTSQTSPLLAMVSATMSSSGLPVIDNDESGTSSVAIDNKIEQAMDLVKSHLMFAVREEVEVLKEQIKELLEKNSQLEYENSILRADASPETLAKLQSGQP